MKDKAKGVDALIIVREAYELAFVVDRIADQMLSKYPMPTARDWRAASDRIQLLKVALFGVDSIATLDKVPQIFDIHGNLETTDGVRVIAHQVAQLSALFRTPPGFETKDTEFRAGLYKEIASDIRLAAEMVQPWLASDYPIQSLGIAFQEELHVVTRYGCRKPCQLTRSQWQAFAAIYRVNARGVACPASQIAVAWGDDGASDNTIESTISAIRRELSPLKIDIRNERGKGYRIVHVEHESKAKQPSAKRTSKRPAKKPSAKKNSKK